MTPISVTEPGWDRFWLPDRRGVVAMVRKGKYLHIAGGLLAPPQHKRELLQELLAYAAARQLVVTFFNVAEDELPLLRSFGFQATKWGEEALIDLRGCTWAGRGYQWVRRQTSFCLRHGLVVSGCRREAMTPGQWDDPDRRDPSDLAAVSSQEAAGGRTAMAPGAFRPGTPGPQANLHRPRRHGAGRIEGFLVCNPCRQGALWAMETCRQRPDAVRGTIPFLMHQAMQTFQGEGVSWVSLCLIPGLRCQTPLAGDSRLARWGLALGTRYFGLVFDTAGAYHFKTRFRPRFENRYLCVHPRVTLGFSWALIRLLGVLRLDLGKVVRLLASRWQKRASRATLRTPESPAL